jgi:glycosyltransferase involved in cell wall biosynthesis
MRVCFVTPNAAATFFPDLDPAYGGSETQSYLNSVQLATSPDVDVHVIAHGQPDWPARIFKGVTVHFTPILPGLKPKWSLQRLMRSIEAEVYIQQGIGSVTKEVAFHGLYRNRSFVYWVASDFDIDRTVGRKDLTRNRWFEWGMRRADLHVVQTVHQASLLREIYGRDSLLIRNAFPCREPAHEERGIILWIGRFVPVKRPELFIELARKIPGESFVMIAPPPSERALKPWYERYVKEAETTPNLDYIPGVPLGDIDGFFDRAKIFVNTSVTEGFPNTFVQAMWAGTPLASLDFDPDGIIANRGLGVCSSGDFGLFADEVRDLARDGGRLSNYSEAAYSRARKYHDLSRNMDELAARLRRLTVS